MFDPFGDFETAGYLRNSQRVKDQSIIKILEHERYRTQLPKAVDFLASVKHISYQDFLHVHKILFSDLYPWAGQDRAHTMPDRAVIKGSVLFCHPADCERAIRHGLALAQEGGSMAEQPGRVMGIFAYGHPFLDGNGRTMLLVHAELCMRAGMSVDWLRTDKARYLQALSKEIAEPNLGHLDAYMRQFVTGPISRDQWLQAAADIRGLDGWGGSGAETTPRYEDPGVAARQREFDRRRNYDLDRGL
ncbi:Fic/DOC family protein [Castellaniella sp. UC4442_H9]